MSAWSFLLPRFSLWPSLFLLLLVLTASGLLAIGCAVSGDAEPERETIEELPPEFTKLAEVWALLEEKHIDADGIDPQAAADGAIRGMIDSIDDPHAAYLDSSQYWGRGECP